MIYYNGLIILYGGTSNKGLEDEKFYQYSIENKQWTIFAVTGVNPGSRTQHSMHFYSQDVLVIFGGKLRKDNETNFDIVNDIYCVNLKEKAVSTLLIEGSAPTARYGHKSACNVSFSPDEYSFIGGIDKDKVNCPLDVYAIVDQDVLSNRNRMECNLTEPKDDPVEIAKAMILELTNQLELLDTEYNDVNNQLYVIYF